MTTEKLVELGHGNEPVSNIIVGIISAAIGVFASTFTGGWYMLVVSAVTAFISLCLVAYFQGKAQQRQEGTPQSLRNGFPTPVATALFWTGTIASGLAGIIFDLV